MDGSAQSLSVCLSVQYDGTRWDLFKTIEMQLRLDPQFSVQFFLGHGQAALVADIDKKASAFGHMTCRPRCGTTAAASGWMQVGPSPTGWFSQRPHRKEDLTVNCPFNINEEFLTVCPLEFIQMEKNVSLCLI